MIQNRRFIKAYRDFRESIDFSGKGILPDLDNLIWCMLMEIPAVPADDDASGDGPFDAIDQRVAILKAVFVEVNKDQPDEFLDEGLAKYDQAGRITKKMVEAGASAQKQGRHGRPSGDTDRCE